MFKNSFFICFVFICLATVFAQSETIIIDSDFPGGNIKVNNVSGDTIYLVPDLRDTKGEWFYWCFRVKKAQNRTIYFQFEQKNVFTFFGPAVSKDNGLTWTWMGENAVIDNKFSFSFSPDDSCVSFSMAMPYTQENLKRFLEKLLANDYLKQERLCTTRKGRNVEKLVIRHPHKKPTYKVLLTARHHACEMMVNYVLEGLVESLLFEKDLEWLRNHVEFWIIPFMDKDGVEDGDQGKNRIPHDHNRDYSGESIYASTATLRKKIPDWSENKLKIAMDLHCPWIKGNYNEVIYFVGIKDSVNAREQQRFCSLLEKTNQSQLTFKASDFLPYGTAWNTGKNYKQGTSFTGWAVTLDGISLATSLEFPYANIYGEKVTKKEAENFGTSLAYSINAYLADNFELKRQ